MHEKAADEESPRNKALDRVNDELEQALIVAEQAREEADQLGDERDALQKRVQHLERDLAVAHGKLEQGVREETRRFIRERSDVRSLRREADQSQAQLSVLSEELQVLMERLEESNHDLSSANAALEERVAERTAAIQATNDALMRSEERLSLAQRHAAAGIWDWEPHGGTLTWSEECALLFGRREGALTLSYDDWMAIVHPADRAETDRQMRDILFGTGPEFAMEYRIDHRARGTRWLASKGRVERDESGRATRLIGLVFDITERRGAEEAARQAQRTAEDANAARSRFLAAASHDLRQPVMAASLFLDLLRGKNLDEDALKLVDLVGTSLSSLQGMLNGLLELARLEAGVVEPHPRNFELDDLLHRLLAEFEGQARAARLSLRIAPTTAVVRCDLLLLELILRNLLSNALKYTEKGGVTVECSEADGHVRVDVIDTGVGIAADQVDRIFDEFYQVPTRERDARGFGLGLATVGRVAKLLDIPLAVRSESGKGSVFSVQLPAAHAPHVAAANVAAAEPRRDLAGTRVLVVEDDPEVRNAMGQLLGSWGVEVMPAASLEAAKDWLAKDATPPDLVFADYELGEAVTGIDVVAALRQHAAVPCILITGNTDAGLLRAVDNLHCRLLHKPATPDEIRKALVAALAVTPVPDSNSRRNCDDPGQSRRHVP